MSTAANINNQDRERASLPREAAHAVSLDAERAACRRRRRKKALAVTAGLLLLTLLGGLLFAERAIHGRGRAYRLARSLYGQFKEQRVVRANAALAALDPPTRADAPLSIYSGAQGGLAQGWADWSWAKRDMADRSLGRPAIRFIPREYQGIYLHSSPIATDGYGLLQVQIRRDASDVGHTVKDLRFTVQVARPPDNAFLSRARLSRYLTPLDADWQQALIPLADLGVTAGMKITGVCIQADAREPQPSVLIDNIALLPDPKLPEAPRAATVAVTVQMDRARQPISPLIYGVAFAGKEDLLALRPGINRWGGNPNTRHNWVKNTWNRGRDWRFQNSGGKKTQPGAAADGFVRGNIAAGVQSLYTVPTIGWVAKDGDSQTASVGVPKEGGPGIAGSDGPIAGYDPTENRRRTSVASRARKGRPFRDPPVPEPDGTIYQDEHIFHLTNTFGKARHGGVRFYAMDNEPDLWDHTHTDVHPARMGYDDMLRHFTEYATAVKDVDPSCEVTGPVSWGWTGYFYSAKDRGGDNYRTHADRKAHGDQPFLLWFLKAVAAHDKAAGRRHLDVLDVHYYPQDGVYSDRTDPATCARRLRAVRSLWDPNYVDESWIADRVRLIPRLKEWIAQGYPGTKVGITEWSFGGDKHMSGALAIAETLGVFGREGVYLACYWTRPPAGSPGYRAFQLLRNPDGDGKPGFGDVSVAARSDNDVRLSVYAAQDSADGALTLLLVNKMPHATVTVPITVTGARLLATSDAPRWTLAALSDDGRDALIRRQTHTVTAEQAAAGRLSVQVPPYSATVLRLPCQGGQP